MNASAALKRLDDQAREIDAERSRLMVELAHERDQEIEAALPAIMRRATEVFEADRSWEPVGAADALEDDR